MLVRVLIAADGLYPFAMGGSYRYVFEVATRLNRKGCDVTVVVPAPVAGEVGGISIVSAGAIESGPIRKMWTLSGGVWMATRRLSEVRSTFDILWINSPLVAYGMRSVIGRLPSVSVVHGPVGRELAAEHPKPWMLAKGLRWFGDYAESWLLAQSRVVVFDSRYMADEVLQARKVRPARVEIIPCGVDTEKFVCWPEEVRRRERVAKGIDDRLVVFTARRLRKRVGLDWLIEAFGQLALSETTAELFIAGEGPERDSLEELVRRQGGTVGDRVHFLGLVSDEDLVAWYNIADAVVVPSRSLEGFGLTSLEAMACGTVVVATNTGANPEIVGQLNPDFVVSPAALVTGLRAALVADNVREQATAVARRYTWDRTADSMMRLFEEVLAHDRRPTSSRASIG